MPISSSETPSSAAEDFGPYFFAFASEGDAFDSAIHTRFDDDIFDFQIDQVEGDFATLTMTVKNPRIGLLAPGRQIWGWFSWWNGTHAVPLFFGRLVGLPEDLADETVKFNFIARPSNFQTQKDALAASLRVRPYWDPIWFDSSTRFVAENVLESRPEHWHVDRVTHLVTTSNIIDGEDGTAVFDEDLVFYDSVKVSYGQNPLRTVTVNAAVSWQQQGAGNVNMPAGLNIQPAFNIESYTGAGLAAAWPKPGDSIGGGWVWSQASVTTVGIIDSSLIGDIGINSATGLSFYLDGGFDTSLGVFEKLPDGTTIGFSYHVAIPNITLIWHLQLGWNVSRQRTENLTFTLTADVQDIITLADDGEALVLSFSTSEVTNAIDPGPDGSSISCGDGGIPIGNSLARSYFNTDRGAQSIEYLIAIARVNLLARARCVNVTYEMAFENFVKAGITLRMNSTLEDPRLPGTNVGGKISSYSFGLINGAQFASLTIACSIGKDGTNDQIGGTPDYVDAGYVEVGYQTFSGQYNLPFGDSSVAYSDQSNVQPNDDGLNFNNFTSHVIKKFQLLGANKPGETQEDALDRFNVVTNADLSLTTTNTEFAQITIQLPDLTGGPFETDYLVQVTDLKIPRTINLEAPSEGASS